MVTAIIINCSDTCDMSHVTCDMSHVNVMPALICVYPELNLKGKMRIQFKPQHNTPQHTTQGREL